MPTTRLIDANVILRFLTNDPPDWAARAATVFSAVAAGKLAVVVEDVVLAEVVWTLRSCYQAERADIANQLISLIADDNVLNRDKQTLSSALALYLHYNLGFADALLAARSLAHDDLDAVSFDRGLDRVPGLRRHEPA